MNKLFIAAANALLILLLPAMASTPKWPSVRHQSLVFHFVDGRAEAFSATILSASGTALYQLQCASAHASEQLSTADDVWAGDLECHLQPTKPEKIYYQSLLVASSDPLVSSGRAVFTAYMLKGRCAEYPDWGLTREFHLRRMKIVLAITHPVFQPYSEQNHFTGLQSAMLTITIEPDANAASEVAEPTKYAEPKVLNPDESDYNKYRVDCTHQVLKRR